MDKFEKKDFATLDLDELLEEFYLISYNAGFLKASSSFSMVPDEDTELAEKLRCYCEEIKSYVSQRFGLVTVS